jgi:hypothetical protein
MAMVLGPAFLGLAVATPIASYSPLSVLSVCLTMVLSFLFGISLSFVVSVIGSRSRAALALMVLMIMAVLVGYGVFHLYGMEAFLPPLGFQGALPPFGNDPGAALPYLMASVMAFLAFTILAILFVPEQHEAKVKKKGPSPDLLPSYLGRLGFARSYQPLLAKEFVDLKRSGTIGKMAFSFIAPLTFLSFTTWYVNNGLDVPVGFNLVFYAVMVGFFGIMLYSMMTNMDVVDYFETLPVSVPRVIRSKLFVFLVLTMSISTAFVLAIALLNNETRLLWLALPALFATSIYMGVAMSYLTGLHPNSFLFNPQVLFRFSIISLLPDISLTILSFSVDSEPVVAGAGILSVLAVLLGIAYLLLRRLDRRWVDAGFN